MKRSEFILQYCAASNMSIHEYTRHFIALPCNCKEDGCEGWATIPNSPLAIANHFELCDYKRDNMMAELDSLQPLRGDLQAIVRPLTPACPTCMDGTAPTEYTRTGRATYVCNDCRRDVSMAVLFLGDDE